MLKSKPFVSIPSGSVPIPKHHQTAFFNVKQNQNAFFIEVPNYFWPIWANPRRQPRSWKKKTVEKITFFIHAVNRGSCDPKDVLVYSWCEGDKFFLAKETCQVSSFKQSAPSREKTRWTVWDKQKFNAVYF